MYDSFSISVNARVVYSLQCTKFSLIFACCRLWLETVNALRPPEMQQMRPLTHQNLTEDPLTILRCNPKVFRYADIRVH